MQRSIFEGFKSIPDSVSSGGQRPRRDCVDTTLGSVTSALAIKLLACTFKSQ